jgi:hypothetical protein
MTSQERGVPDVGIRSPSRHLAIYISVMLFSRKESCLAFPWKQSASISHRLAVMGFNFPAQTLFKLQDWQLADLALCCVEYVIPKILIL